MKHFKLFLLVMALLTVPYILVNAQTVNPLCVDGRVYFKLKNDAFLNVADNNGNINPKDVYFLGDMVGKYGITNMFMSFKSAKSDALQRTYRIEFEAKERIADLIADLSRLPIVEYAEPAPLFFISAVPNDPYYDTTLTSQTHSANASWHLNLINAAEAWDVTEGDSTIVVAVLDNAIFVDHEDLRGKIHSASIDLGNGDDDPTPPQPTYMWSHGTHSAGLVGARTNNGIGVASIGNKVSIMAVKMGDDNSDGQAMSVGYECINYAADHGADVISMSWGSPLCFQTMQNVVNYAYNKGCVLVAAAGNNGNGMESQMNPDLPVNYTAYPAALKHVIAVGSCDFDDRKSDFSCYGTWLDLLAPGGFGYKGEGFSGMLSNFSVLSTTYSEAGTSLDMFTGASGGAGNWGVEGQYDLMQGTSMACPVTSGLCGLMLSANPRLTPEELTNILKSTCVNVDSLNTNFVDSIGSGRIDAHAAVLAAKNVDTTVVADFFADNTVIDVGQTVNFTDASTGSPTTWAWTFEGGSPETSDQQNPTGIRYDNAGTYKVTLTVSNGSATDTEIKTYFILVGQRNQVAESGWDVQETHLTTINRSIYNIDIADANTMWGLAVDGSTGEATNDYIVTADGGATWSAKAFAESGQTPIDISAVNGTTAWMATVDANTGKNGAIFKTTNGGETWTRQGSSLFANANSSLNVIHFFNENDGYCQGNPVNGKFEIYLTSDGGDTWTPLGDNAPAATSGELGQPSLDVSIGDMAWFATNKGRILKTTDKGATWTPITVSADALVSLSFADEQNGLVYSKSALEFLRPSKFLKTTDGGTTWSELNVSSNGLNTFSLVPGRRGMIVAAKQAAAIGECFSAYSLDWGQTWTNIDDSIPYVSIKMLDTQTGYAGSIIMDTDISCLYKWRPVDLPTSNTNDAIDKVVVYPNPARNSIYVTNCLHAKYTIFDVTGRMLKTGSIDSDNHGIDLSDITSGNLFIRIVGNDKTVVKKIVKM